MEIAAIPSNEEARIAALRQLNLLDTEPDPFLDRITEVASRYFDAPISVVTLVDTDRQWFKSRVGLQAQETSRDVAFCAHAIRDEQAFIVNDASLDARFADNPLVLGDPNIRFYAGQPLKGPDAQLIGTLCVIDITPREFSDSDRLMLAVLAEAAERVLLSQWEREMQAKALESAEALAKFVDTTAFGVITTDDEGNIEEFNRGAQQIFGYTSEEVKGTDFIRLMPQATPGTLLSHFTVDPALASNVGGAEDRLIEGVRKSGEHFPLAMSVSEFRVGGRRVFTGLVFDMSALVSAQADSAAFFGLSIDLFCIVDGQGRLVRANPAFQEILGYTEEELQSISIMELMFPEDREFVMGTMARLLEDGTAVEGIEARAVCKDGSIRRLIWAGRFDPDTGRIYASARDVTELEQLRSDIDQFFGLSVDILCIVDAKGRFVRVNPAFVEAFGYSEEEVIGQRFTKLVAPQDVERSVESVARQVEGAVSKGFESRTICKDGTLRTVLWTSQADPTTLSLYATGRDITEQKLRDAELARLVDIVEESADFIALFDTQGDVQHVNRSWRRLLGWYGVTQAPGSLADLYGDEIASELLKVATPIALQDGMWTGESVIAYADGELEVQQTVLAHSLTGDQDDRFMSVVSHDVSAFKEVERVKNEFISTVSHELRTPLTSIRGSLGLLEGGAMGELPDKAKSMVKIASQNTDRLVRLINDVLDLEKMSAGKLELKLGREDLSDVVVEAVDGVDGMANAQSITLATDIQESAFPAEIDHDRIVQVITNLLSNAIKFSNEDSTVTVRLQASGAAHATIEVIDHGDGIPDDKLDFVFARFSQVDSTSTRAKGGTGLGLAITQEIVEQHGGTVSVTSELGVGSTFTVRLPLASQDSSGQLEQAASPEMTSVVRAVAENSRAMGQATSSLLVVEDDPQLSLVMVALLEGAGHQVRSAGTVDAAREILATMVPDAILLDLNLPDGHGLDLLEVLRGDDRLQDVRVMVVSGSQDAPNEMPMPVVVNWLRKPFTNQEMLRSIGLALETRLRPSVLVVEDDAATRQVVSAMLEAQGIDVRQAGNGLEALNVIEHYRPDLIILDLHMPVMDGYEFLNARNPLEASDIPIVIYTGEDLTAAQQNALSAGLTTFLTKTRTDDAHFIATVMEALSLQVSASE
ncbi:MAG: PAS domain S-box protein [Actinomycetota bacterium]|nr:PAS domain S-box protein [Actinomycetota bacterium]